MAEASSSASTSSDFSLVANPNVDEDRSERLLRGGATLCSVAEITGIFNAVCRIRAPRWNGTGFIIGDGLLLTCNHILPDAETCRNAQAEFFADSDHASLIRGAFSPDDYFVTSPAPDEVGSKLKPIDAQHLDYTVVALKYKEELQRAFRHPIAIKECNERPAEVFIVQHPGGGCKQVSLDNNRVQSLDERPIIKYQTETDEGSSGSPVLFPHHGQLQLIAVHCRGNSTNNTGTHISDIIGDLRLRDEFAKIRAWSPRGPKYPHRYALTDIGLRYVKDGKSELGIGTLMLAAERGDPAASFDLAYVYATQDLKKAASWCHKAIEQAQKARAEEAKVVGSSSNPRSREKAQQQVAFNEKIVSDAQRLLKMLSQQASTGELVHDIVDSGGQAPQ